MSNLYCGAVNCGNNHDRLCALAEIAVRGADAACCEETCCASFADGAGLFLNAFGAVRAAPETQIACTAQGCVWNQDGACEAQRVRMEGAYAHHEGGTCCRSFRPERRG